MLSAPFPWFGGKSRCSHIVWEAFRAMRHSTKSQGMLFEVAE